MAQKANIGRVWLRDSIMPGLAGRQQTLVVATYGEPIRRRQGRHNACIIELYGRGCGQRRVLQVDRLWIGF